MTQNILIFKINSMNNDTKNAHIFECLRPYLYKDMSYDDFNLKIELCWGYKAFDSNLKSTLGYEYAVDTAAIIDTSPKFGQVGFHFCQIGDDCNRYYPYCPQVRHCEVVSFGTCLHQHGESVTDKLFIYREIKATEWMNLTGVVDEHFSSNAFDNYPTVTYSNGRKEWWVNNILVKSTHWIYE
jgi:hypothetical protein